MPRQRLRQDLETKLPLLETEFPIHEIEFLKKCLHLPDQEMPKTRMFITVEY